MPRRFATPVVLDARVVVGAGGGPEKTILNSPRFLAPAGYRNLCAYLHAPEDPGFSVLRDRAAAWGAPLLSILDRGPLDGGVFTEMLRICRREKVAIWHGHDYKSNLLGLLLRPFWPMRLVTTLHGWVHHTRRTPLYYAIDRLCLPFYERVLCVSPDLYTRALQCGVRRPRCLLVENGIDTEQYARQLSRDQARQQCGLPTSRVVVGAVGRLSAEKGFDLLIRVVHQLVQEGLDLELWIIGSGDQEAALRHLIADLRQQERIRLLGYRNDTLLLYQAMDVFALSSLREGLPNVLLEAMALEVPVLATRIAGVPRLIDDGVNGLLVEPGDAANLLAGLRHLISAPALRRQLAEAGRHTIEARYSFAARMEKVRLVYDQLLCDSAPKRGA